MSTALIVKSWKDPIFRASLGDAVKDLVPANPAGSTSQILLSDLETYGDGSSDGSSSACRWQRCCPDFSATGGCTAGAQCTC
jgi:mersacidin/lichenicidin family type 2 lantibiotic